MTNDIVCTDIDINIRVIDINTDLISRSCNGD